VADGPFLIDCFNDEPWRSLRKPIPPKPARPPIRRTTRARKG
jgi:hypothetical protein